MGYPIEANDNSSVEYDGSMKEVWIVFEKRGSQEIPKYVCRFEATANRLNEAYDGITYGYIIKKGTATKINGLWVGPVEIIQPTEEDFKQQDIINEHNKKLELKKRAINKAKECLTSEEFDALFS